jgi:hypothetical protein
MDPWLTLSEFRASRNISSKRFAELVRAGFGPNVTTMNRIKIVTAEAAQAFDIAEGDRIVAMLTHNAKRSAADTEEQRGENE